jgi:thiamine monophosphate kinase
VGAVVYAKSIPVHADARSAKEALFMGEDFELLFTVHQKQLKKLKALGCTVTPIGHIVDKKSGLRLLDSTGRVRPIKHRGFTHF